MNREEIKIKPVVNNGKKMYKCQIIVDGNVAYEGTGLTRKAARDAAIVDKQLMAGGIHLTEYGSEWMR